MADKIIKPIETEFNGDRFRSKLEAQWAVVFNDLGIRYEYEPDGFELEDGTRYLPDFYFPDGDAYGEVKPDRPGALDELLEKPLRFVQSGAVKRLVILSNIPPATEEDPVWWLPAVAKNPFLPDVDGKCQNFDDLIVGRARLDAGRIDMTRIQGVYEVPHTYGFCIDIDFYRRNLPKNDLFSRKNTEEYLRNVFLRAVPSRNLAFYNDRKSDPVSDFEDYKGCVLSAFRKGWTARFDHGQTPAAKK